MEPKSKIKPIKEFDLDKISVYELIKMLDSGCVDACYIMMSLKAAEQRLLDRFKELDKLKSK